MFLSSLVSSKALVAATATGLVALGGGAAAYAGALPASLQTAAHQAIGAPAADEPTDEPSDEPSPTETPSPSETSSEEPTPTDTASPTVPVGPDATGPAAYGLCNAYLHGGLAPTSVAYRNLMTAADLDGIDAYCANVAKPGKPTSEPTDQSTDEPTPVRTDQPSHPTGKPSWVTKGQPTTHPGH